MERIQNLEWMPKNRRYSVRIRIKGFNRRFGEFEPSNLKEGIWLRDFLRQNILLLEPLDPQAFNAWTDEEFDTLIDKYQHQITRAEQIAEDAATEIPLNALPVTKATLAKDIAELQAAYNLLIQRVTVIEDKLR